MTSEKLLVHLSEVDYLQDVEILSESELDYGANFIIGRLSFEPGMAYEDSMTIPFVYYAEGDILFSPCDWQQGNLPKTSHDIDTIDWRIDVTETEAVNAFGFPMLPSWVQQIEKTEQANVRSEIGRQIKEAREKAGLTVRELAEKAGLSHSHIVRIEAGKYSVTIDTLYKICQGLGLRIALI